MKFLIIHIPVEKGSRLVPVPEDPVEKGFTFSGEWTIVDVDHTLPTHSMYRMARLMKPIVPPRQLTREDMFI